MTYEGWVRRSGKKEAYLVKNKRICAGFTNSRKFKKLRDTKIAEEYNVDEIETKIVNGDGASWIKEGLLYRHLGTMEHNICDVLAQRMKGRKMSWSIKGANNLSNNLSKILAEKFSGSLYTTIDRLLYGVIPDQKFEEIVDVIKKVASKVPDKLKKQKTYKIHKATLPFEGCAVTEGRKAIRNIFNDRCATELIYR